MPQSRCIVQLRRRLRAELRKGSVLLAVASGDTRHYITGMGEEARSAHGGRPIRVCHITSGPLNGGAARGAVTLHRALSDVGCDSTLVTDVVGGIPTDGVVQLPALIHPRIEQAARRSLEQLPTNLYRRRSRFLFTTGLFGRSATGIPQVNDADIVHLHWLGGGLLSLSSLRHLRKPVVWTMRDAWPTTGGCHHPTIHNCTRFETGCGSCPQLASSKRIDLSRFVLWNKSRGLPANLTLVGNGDWVAQQARRSSIFRDREVVAIPGCIDTEVFAPFDKVIARRILGLPEHGKIVVAGALTPADPYKGWPLLVKALAQLPRDYQTVSFGNIAKTQLELMPSLIHSFGHVHDDRLLRLIYVAADVHVSAATVETFGKTVVESLACGTPVVAFAATGQTGLVKHLDSGYLATPFDPTSLAEGMVWVVSHPDASTLSRSARARAVEHFSMPVAARAYMSLYHRLLGIGA